MNDSSFIDAFEKIIDPLTAKTLKESASMTVAHQDQDHLIVNLTLHYPCPTRHETWKWMLEARAQELQKNIKVTLHLSHHVLKHKIKVGVKTHSAIKNVIAVASGKGGVGKSTVAANLALALKAQGAQVGLLDADIYGPSIPLMMGVYQKPEINAQSQMQPLVAHGLQLMSMGFLVPQEQAVIWRGPMLTQALEQMFYQTAWNELDYLIVDLPPGTGDIQLAMAQKLPVTAAVMVTTPQDMALSDVNKAIAMFQKLDIPMVGIVENMALYCCPQCGHIEPIFGQEGGKRLSQDQGIDYLGSLPLHIEIRKASDEGAPIVVKQPQSEWARLYQEMAVLVAAKIATLDRDFSHQFGAIRVES